MAKNVTPNFPLLLSAKGRATVKEAAVQDDCSESDVIRKALQLYFEARGKGIIDFSPGRHGGKRK